MVVGARDVVVDNDGTDAGSKVAGVVVVVDDDAVAVVVANAGFDIGGNESCSDCVSRR